MFSFSVENASQNLSILIASTWTTIVALAWNSACQSAFKTHFKNHGPWLWAVTSTVIAVFLFQYFK
jgi:hypothetical protein